MIGMQVTTRTGAILTAVRISHRKRYHSHFIWHCSVCSLDEELWPEGAIRGNVSDVRRSTPCGCSSRRPYRPEQMLVKAERAAAAKGYSFFGWVGGYHGSNRTECLLSCAEHGPWITKVHVLTVLGGGCPSCGLDSQIAKKTLPEEYYLSKVSDAIADTDWKILGSTGEYVGVKTRLSVECPEHGVFESTYNAYLHGKAGCSGCAKYGFDYTKSAYLYLLKSECGGYVKVGITANTDFRLNKLRLATPFLFTPQALWVAAGMQVRTQEKAFHKSFESAGFRGFDGATEWLKADPAIVERFNLLPGALSMPDLPFADVLASLG